VRAALNARKQAKDPQRVHCREQDGALTAQPGRFGRDDRALAGLPIVVKDNINTADMPTSGGTPPAECAPQECRRRCKKCGCRRYHHGKTNMHESHSDHQHQSFSFAGR